METWESLGPVWQECFLLAWESFRAGSVPVGAVVVDADGAVVARGRNRRNEPGGPHGSVSNSGLAHAEINALVALPPADYGDHVMYTTLEPCLLCTAALRQCRVGTVRFAGEDPMWTGIERLAEALTYVGTWWTRREGPLGGPFQRLAIVLHLVWALGNGARPVVDCYTEARPDAVRIAERLVGPPADRLRAMSLAEALPQLTQMQNG